MRDIKKSKSERIKTAYLNYLNSPYYELTDAYKNPSINKAFVWEECKSLMERYRGFHLKIITFNSFMFTCGFFGYIENKLSFFYVTPEHIIIMDL